MDKVRSRGAIAGLAMLGAAVFAAPAIAADDQTETRSVPEFSRINIEGAMDVEVQVGKSQSVEITADRKYLSRVTTEVEGDTLVISQEGRRWHDADVDVFITVKNLSAFIVDGAADGDITGINSDSFDLEIDGAGDITLSGKCGEANYEINGAGDVSAENLKCKAVTITINGAGDADVYASESVRAVLNGVGDITVYGNPRNVRPTISGFGSFEVVDE